MPVFGLHLGGAGLMLRPSILSAYVYICTYVFVYMYRISSLAWFLFSYKNVGVKENAEKNAENHHIQWADSQEMAGCRLSFDSIPFQIVGVKVSECQNGPDRSKALKRKEAQKRPKRDVSMHNN